MQAASIENHRIADLLREMAGLLKVQRANPFRSAAYSRAADTIIHLGAPLRELFDRDGREALQRVAGIGPGIASAIAEILVTGHWNQLDALRGSVEPVRLLQGVPGIGPELAKTLYATLHVETLEALEIAANDGRIESVPGVGPRRARMIRASLAEMLGRLRPPARRSVNGLAEPVIATVLAVDHEYRTSAVAGKLRMIAPKRFNPTGEAWLPVLHCIREGWHFTALYSNTAQAHRLNRTRDWVVIYFYDADHVEGQCTVVTETHGELMGRRVVRGREDECREHYLPAA